MIVEMGFNVLMIIKITLMIIELMIVEMVIIFLMMSHHHQINDAVIIKLMIVEKGLYSFFSFYTFDLHKTRKP